MRVQIRGSLHTPLAPQAVSSGRAEPADKDGAARLAAEVQAADENRRQRAARAAARRTLAASLLRRRLLDTKRCRGTWRPCSFGRLGQPGQPCSARASRSANTISTACEDNLGCFCARFWASPQRDDTLHYEAANVAAALAALGGRTTAGDWPRDFVRVTGVADSRRLATALAEVGAEPIFLVNNRRTPLFLPDLL